MSKAYSLDLRERVAAACDRREGTKREIAIRFGVSERFVYYLMVVRRERGSLVPLPASGGPKARLSEGHRETLARLLREQSDATLEELRERSGVPVSAKHLSSVVRAMNWRRKKKA